MSIQDGGRNRPPFNMGVQEDASRRITAGFDADCAIRVATAATPIGAFVKYSGSDRWGLAQSTPTTKYGITGIDSGLVVPTAAQFQVANFSCNWWRRVA
jgi:hypothetical protein